MNIFVTAEIKDHLDNSLDVLRKKWIPNADISDVVNIYIRSILSNLYHAEMNDMDCRRVLRELATPLKVPQKSRFYAVRITLDDESTRLIKSIQDDIRTDIQREVSPALLVNQCIISDVNCLRYGAMDYIGEYDVYDTNITRPELM